MVTSRRAQEAVPQRKTDVKPTSSHKPRPTEIASLIALGLERVYGNRENSWER